MTTDCVFEAVILDMDGVITQTATLHARVWKEMFDEYLAERGQREGRSYEPFDSDADYAQYVDGKPRYDGVRSFLRARGIELPAGSPADPPTRESDCGLGNRKNVLFHRLISKVGVDVYEDTLQQIQRWKQQGVKLAVISSSRNCSEILQAAGVRQWFEVKIDGNDLARLGLQGKPAPDMFLHAAAQLGVSPSRTVVVEDAFSGVQAGRAGGFALVVGVAREDNAAALQEHGADVVVDDLRKLSDSAATLNSAASMNAPNPQGPSHPQGPSPAQDSALEHFDHIAAQLADRHMALFLDYDGTLTPIVDRPEDAILPPSMRALLAELSRRQMVAIVSGRDLANVRQMVALDNLVYAGSHGFDIAGPDGLRLQHEQAQQCLPELDAAQQELHSRLGAIAGVRIERKHFAIAIHYRLAADGDLSRIEAAVDEVHRAHRALRKKGGKKIFELQPDVPWHKGRAVLWLRQMLGLDRPDVITLYIGDDETDEDAFAALAEQQRGLGIRVGPAGQRTHAPFYLQDCDAVQQFLEALRNSPNES